MGTTERRRREAAPRRQAILDAARKVFWQRGYTGATMPRIAEVAELAPGTLYLYFAGKDALYVELLLEGYDLLIERLQAATGEHDEPARQAAGLIDAFFAFAREYPQYFDILFFVLQREDSKWEGSFPAEQVAKLHACEDACKQAAADILDRAGFGPPRRRADLVEAVWGMLAGVVFYFRTRESFDRVADQAKRVLLTAVFGEE
jgi:AcrR family transcriptional regulator